MPVLPAMCYVCTWRRVGAGIDTRRSFILFRFVNFMFQAFLLFLAPLLLEGGMDEIIRVNDMISLFYSCCAVLGWAGLSSFYYLDVILCDVRGREWLVVSFVSGQCLFLFGGGIEKAGEALAINEENFHKDGKGHTPSGDVSDCAVCLVSLYRRV